MFAILMILPVHANFCKTEFASYIYIYASHVMGGGGVLTTGGTDAS